MDDKVKKQMKQCGLHNINYDLIGNDDDCELNCLICCDCLRSLDHEHKDDGVNHKTITLKQLQTQFANIKEERKEEIEKCKARLNQYMFKVIGGIMREVQTQKMRLIKTIEKIMLTEITSEENKLTIIEKLYQSNYDEVICKQVNSIDKLLLNHKPSAVSSGYKEFIKYVDKEEEKLEQKIKVWMNNPQYDSIVLKNCEKDINYPQFSSLIVEQFSLKNKSPTSSRRVLSEEKGLASPKRTFRRSLKKDIKRVPSQQQSKSLNTISIKIKNPVQFNGSSLFTTKEDTQFFQKILPRKIFKVKMLYKASENDFSIKRFHQYCDGQINTVVVAKTQFNKVIGGFNPLPWKSTNNTLHPDTKKEAFLFSLTLKQKMQLIDPESAIFNSINYGPTFGKGADFAICHKANTQKTSYCEFPYSYGNSRYLQSNQHSTFLFTGQSNGKHFCLKEWQVWKIYFMND